MKPEPRFTFVFDRYNRTAVAALISSLEKAAVPERTITTRLARGRHVLELDFDSGNGVPEYVCVSAMTENFPDTVGLLGDIRRKFGPGPVLVCGGPHATGDPGGVLDAGFDVCAIGEGEGILPRLLEGSERFEQRTQRGLQQAGYGKRSEGSKGVPRGIKIAGRAANLEDFAPLPRRTYFPGSIEISRGCRWGCAYCQTPRIFGHAERSRSVGLIEETVRRYAEAGMKDIRLLLPNALGYQSSSAGKPNCETLERLLGAIKLAGSSKPAGSDAGKSRRDRPCRIFLGSFPSEVRPDYVTAEAISILKKYVANRRIVIGAQSGSQRVLDAVKRGHSVGAIREACEIVRSSGFMPAADIVVGFPMEEPEDRAATFDLVERLGRSGATVNMHFFMPLPGTLLADSRPRFLTEAERKYLDGLAAKGVVRGSWRRQEQIAREAKTH